MNKKSQAAMEFLMTYGWAILAVLISIAALSYFGVLSPGNLLPESCTLFPGVACTDFIVTQDSIYLVLSNGFGKEIQALNISATGCTYPGQLPGGLKEGEKATIFIPGCNFASNRVKSDLSVYYKTINEIPHTRVGSLSGKTSGGYLGLGNNRYFTVDFMGINPVPGSIRNPCVLGNSSLGWPTVGQAAIGAGSELYYKQICRTTALGGTSIFEIALPQGAYSTSFGVGSPATAGVTTVSIEGIVLANGVATAAGQYAQFNNKMVTVNDGKLTLTLTGGAGNYGEITHLMILPA